MKYPMVPVPAVVLSLCLHVSPAYPVEPAAADLLNRINELEQKVRILERQHELDAESAAETARTAPVVSEGTSGFVVRTPDSDFALKVRGYIQADARFFPDDYRGGNANDTFLLRRVRPIFEGTVYQRFDYRLMLDFGQNTVSGSTAGNQFVVQDAYLNARLTPEFQIQLGKFKEPVGLERLQSGANLLFIERAYPTQLVPNRDVGIQLQGDLDAGAINYALGVFNGTSDGGSSDFDNADDDKDLAARVFAQPFRNSSFLWLSGLGFGVAGTWGEHRGPLRADVSPGQQRFFSYRAGLAANQPNVVADGLSWRLVPQLYYYNGPFGLLAEYVISSQYLRQAGGGAGAGTKTTARNTAWQVAASWFVTGEDNSFAAVSPRQAVGLAGGGWGAWEIAARITGLEVDADVFPVFGDPSLTASRAFTWGLGINWHLNRNIKASFNYEQTDFRGGGSNPFVANGEKAFLSRVQFSF